MILVDTSYLIALVNPRDDLYERAQAWSQTVTEPRRWPSGIVYQIMSGGSSSSFRAYPAVVEQEATEATEHSTHLSVPSVSSCS